jgi:F-type H+-transporting ATPase subunit b
MDLLSFNPGLIFWTIVTFVFLLIVLGRFAWKPLLSLLEEREKSIREALEQADKARHEFENLSSKNNAMLAEVRREADEVRNRGRVEADRLRAELVEKAKKDAEGVLAEGRKQLEREYRAALQKLRASVADLAIGAAERILTTGLNEDRQRQLVDEYLRSLPEAESRRTHAEHPGPNRPA